VDVPLGYFFGNADYQNQKQFSSLLLGINENEVYCLFPMPFKMDLLFLLIMARIKTLKYCSKTIN